MNLFLKEFLISVLPISELRVAIPFALSQGAKPLAAFLIAVLGNIIIVPILFLFLDYLHKHLVKIKTYDDLLNKYINGKRKGLEKHIGTKWEFVVLCLFVAIPFPLTGAYTGTILSWFFNLKRKQSYIAIVIGVIIAGIIVTLVSQGIISLF